MGALRTASQTIISGAVAALRRFPVPVLFSALFCILAVGWREHDGIETYLAILFCGFFLFVSVQLFAESRGMSVWLSHATGAALFLLIAWHLHSAPDLRFPFAFLASGLFLSLIIAPYMKRHADGLQLWTFNYRLWTHLALVIVAAVVLFLGLSAIVASLDLLFGIAFHDDIYPDLWLVVATLFSPVCALGGIPEDLERAEEDVPRAIRIILGYVALPLLVAYAVILYAYTAKIALSGELPEGGVAYLVTAFGCAGIVALLVGYPLRGGSDLIGLFHRYFFFILLVPLGLLGVAIAVRIEDYGVTESRYAIMLCLAWLAASAGIAMARRGQAAPRSIIATLVALLILASFGPWGAVDVSARSQVDRLRAILEENRVLVGGRVNALDETLSLAERIEISSIVDYLVDTSKTERIAPWFSGAETARVSRDRERGDPAAILADLGLRYVEPHLRHSNGRPGRFSISARDQAGALDISGYDVLLTIPVHADPETGYSRSFQLDSGTLEISFDGGQTFSLSTPTGARLDFALADAVAARMPAERVAPGRQETPIVLSAQNEAIAAKLIVPELSASLEPDAGTPNIVAFQAQLLVKLR